MAFKKKEKKVETPAVDASGGATEFLRGMVKVSGTEMGGVIGDGLDAIEIDGFVDTGSLALNALLSGTIKGGMPRNKITAFAGEQATGKTYFALQAVKQFLNDNPGGICIYFDSEEAITKRIIEERGIDPGRIAHIAVATVEEFRTQAVKIVDNYLKQPASVRTKRPIILVLDSLGNLSTIKETTDVADGKNVKDMTRAGVIRAAFRVLTLKLGRAKIPMIVTNHTHAVIGSMYPERDMGGGSGLKYCATTIVYLSKRKEKEGTEVVGNVIHCKLFKSRLTKENKMIDTRLFYDRGLDRYYGLLEIGLKQGVLTKVSNKVQFPNGTKAFESQVLRDPEKYLTPDILDQIDAACAKEFKYGQGEDSSTETIDEETGEVISNTTQE